jgi:hypothetical protein
MGVDARGAGQVGTEPRRQEETPEPGRARERLREWGRAHRARALERGYRLPAYTAGVPLGDGVEVGFLCGEEFVSEVSRVFSLAVESYERRRAHATQVLLGGRRRTAVGTAPLSRRFRAFQRSTDGAGRPMLVGSNPFAATLTAQILERFGQGLRLAELRDLPMLLEAERRGANLGLRQLYVDLGLVTLGERLAVNYTVPASAALDGGRQVAGLRLGPTGFMTAAQYGVGPDDRRVSDMMRTRQYRYAVAAERILLLDIIHSTVGGVRQPAYVPLSDLRFVVGPPASAVLSDSGPDVAVEEGDQLYLGYRGVGPPVPASVLRRTGVFSLDSLDSATGLPRRIVGAGPACPFLDLHVGEPGDRGYLIGVGRPGFCRLIYAGEFRGQLNALINISPMNVHATTPQGRIIVVKEAA